MHKHNISLALLLVFFGSVTFFSCERVEKPQTKRISKGQVQLGGCLKIPVRSLPKSFFPSSLNSHSSVKVGIHLHEGLVRLNPVSSEPIPGLAESWSMEEGGSSWVFNLRRGAKFHEAVFFGNRSTEITAQDVVYSFTQLIQNANDQVFNSTIGHRIVGAAAFRKGDETQLDGITVIDDYTVRFTLNKPDKSFLYVLAQPAMGIVPKGLQENETVDLIGAGPFQLASAEGQIVLKRNPDYHLTDEFGNQYPYLDTLVFVKAERNTDRLEMFFNEEVDVIANLELDPVRSILEQHVAEFSGKSPQYIMKRETDNASFETYSIYRAGIKGLGSGFMGYRDYSRVQSEQ